MIVVAPDSFKGSLPAARVAAVVADELRAALPDEQVIERPIADGGEGTVDVALSAGMTAVEARVVGPLGDPLWARYALADGVAMIEMAAAAGLTVLPDGPTATSALAASTTGVGELIADAVRAGATRVVVGLGGSATTDGGAGMAAALGARFVTANGTPLEPGGAGLASIESVDLAPMVATLAGVDVILAIDVDNPLTGPEGAAATYGPQKGAGPLGVAALDRGLARWAEVVAQATGFDGRRQAGLGAAGGTGLPLVAAGCARIESGIDVVMELSDVRKVMSQADLVVVGEGSLDEQSLRGKGPVAAAQLAQSAGSAVVAVVGRTDLGPDALVRAGITQVYALTDIEPDLDRCIRDPEPILRALAARLAADTSDTLSRALANRSDS